jgi:hypothetical protein
MVPREKIARTKLSGGTRQDRAPAGLTSRAVIKAETAAITEAEMHPFIRFCLAGAMLALFAGNANALSGPACASYADQAVKAAEEAARLGCGFGNHPRWGTNREAHNRFCRTASKDTIDFETQERNNSMYRCGRCSQYGATANAQAHENKIFHCGGTGDKWGTGDGHMKWCMSIDYADKSWGMARAAGLVSDWGTKSLREELAREKTLKQCRAKYTKAQIDACHAYASHAVSQVKFNRELQQCNSQGPRFSEDRELHFSWCVGQIETDGVKMTLLTKQESDARDAENKACEDSTVDYGGCAACNRPAGQLWPEKSSGPSPFGGADKSSSQARKGGANLKKSLGDIPKAKADTRRLTVSPRKERTSASGGFNTTKPSSSNSAMDRLTGDTQLPTSSGNSTAKGRNRPSAAGRSPASAEVSAAPKPGIAPALGSKPFPNSTSDYGGCASCGKPAPDKFVPPR